MKVRCRNCGNNFDMEGDNFECPMCGFNTRPDTTNKVILSEVKWNEILFWVVFVGISYIICKVGGLFKYPLLFPFYGLLIILVLSLKRFIKIKAGNYKVAIGERLDRNTVVISDFASADYNKVVYAFYVDGKEYRCTGGNYKSFIYYLFSKPKVKILYNVDDPRQSFEKTSSWIMSYTFLFIILAFLYLLMQVV